MYHKKYNLSYVKLETETNFENTVALVVVNSHKNAKSLELSITFPNLNKFWTRDSFGLIYYW